MVRANFIRESLAPLGINVSVVPVNVDESYPYLLGEVLDENGARDYDLLISDLTTEYPDLTNIVYTLLASSDIYGGFNTAAYENEEVDELIIAQLTETDSAQRFALQRRLMDIVRDDAPYIPLEYMAFQSALNTKYTGLPFTQDWLSYLPVQNVRLAEP
jgi:peptide/nickel transport system substrate-binding protein